MRNPSRRQVLAAITAVPIVAFGKKGLPCGLKELPLPVVKFNGNGEIVNYLELLDGVPFVCERYKNSESEIYVRSRKVWVPKETPVRPCRWGWMELKEVNYQPVSDYYYSSLSYELRACEDTQYIICNREFTPVYDDVLKKKLLKQARKSTKENVPAVKPR